MTKYAHYDATDGRILGFYDAALHKVIPVPKIEINEADWPGRFDKRVDVTGAAPALYVYTPPPPSAAELADARLADVKQECRRRIYAEASAETQMNMATAAAVIAGKDAADRTSDESSILAGAQGALGWVTAMKEQVQTLAVDADADFTADAAWPPLPDIVRVVVTRF
ncbi:hypothetical protein [Ruegeria sp. HKCCD8929]|uniref:hypothetical protein n=1 Tax=Ruegeria sp. HKCCD8929 TaxID=2683006 RepID=UPI0014887A57|nr:hypothetical protein [Ruegeria sp. HKCCD8929]